MRTAFVALLWAATVAGCKAGDRDREGEISKRNADTTVTQRQVQDTAIVRTDTTIKVDTNVDVDTTKKSGSVRGADTTRRRRPR